MPNGVYGNANEVGNYHIGFIFGYAGVASPAPFAQIWSQIKHGTDDESHEQNLLNYANNVGWRLRLAKLH